MVHAVVSDGASARRVCGTSWYCRGSQEQTDQDVAHGKLTRVMSKQVFVNSFQMNMKLLLPA